MSIYAAAAPRVSAEVPSIDTVREMFRRTLFVLVLCAWSTPARAQISLSEEVVGRVSFVFTGGSFVDSQGLDNGARCIEDSATAVIREEDLPPRPTLVKAILTVGGSLIADDGLDYQNPDISLLETPGLDADNAAEQLLVLRAARNVADRSVSLLVPGATTPVTVEAGSSPTFTTAYNRSGPALPNGNVAFFTTRIDVTEVLQDLPSLAGTYEVSDFLADICFGLEARCSAGETCTGLSQVHPNAAASFSLLLIVESDSLPIRSVASFEGMSLLFGTNETLVLDTPEPFSNPASGRLAIYSLEGDLGISGALPGARCDSEEFIEVDGDEDTLVNGLCLTDDDNPVGNLFNSTINVLPEDPTITPACMAPDPIECCEGDGLCGTTGVDIDRFDISPALVPGADQLRVTVGTGTDLIALSSVVLEADLFEPVLDVDSQIRVVEANAAGRVQLGTPITYVIALSNTGNIDATGVDVRMSVPPRVTDFALLSEPSTGTNSTAPLSGLNGTGLISFDNVVVPAGGIESIVFQVTTECDALNLTLRPEASIGTSTTAAFTVASEPVTVVGPGVGLCDGVDPNGPFESDDAVPLPPRVLRGGGCTGAAALPWLLVLVLIPWLLRRRRRA